MLQKIKETAKHGLIYGLGQALSSAASFLLIPLYTNVLTTADYGIIGLLNISITLIVALFGMGINSALFRSYYKYDDEENRRMVVSTALFTLLTSLIFLLILTLTFSRQLSFAILGDAGYSRFIAFSFLSAGFLLLQAIPFAVYRAKQMSIRYVSFSIFFLIFRMALIIYLVAFKEWGVWGIVLGDFTASSLCSILMLLSIYGSFTTKISLVEMKIMLRYGLPLIVVNVCAILLNAADKYILRWTMGLDQVGIYNLAFQFAAIINIIFVQPLGLIWVPMLFSTEKKDYASKYYSKMLTYTLFVGLLFWLGISLLSDEVIRVMSHESYWTARPIIPILTMAYLISCCSSIVRVGIPLKGKTEYSSVGFLLSVALNITLNLYLIIRFGVIGAAASLLITYCFNFGVIYFLSQRLYRVYYEWGRLLTLIIVALTIFFTGNMTDFDNAIIGLSVKFTWAITFPLWLFIFGFYEPEELLNISNGFRYCLGMLKMKNL